MDSDSPLPQRDRLREVLRSLLVPLARLALAHGVKFQDVSDLLKLAFMDAGKETLREKGQRLNASTLSVATGLHRKDLAVFLTQEDPDIDPEPPVEARVFARWTTDPAYLDEEGRPLPLPRGSVSGEDEDGAPAAGASFERLAREVTTDVRPRAVLESMLRLELVSLGEGDVVRLKGEQLVPSRSKDRMLELLRDNSRDHLNAAVANTLGKSPGFLEQSLFATGLSADASERIHQSIRKRWLSLTQALVPQVQRAIDEDKAAIRKGQKASTRLRVGLYFYSEPEKKDKAS